MILDLARGGSNRNLSEPEGFFPPLRVFLIPGDSLFESLQEGRFRFPVQKSFGLFCAARMSDDLTGTVSHEDDFRTGVRQFFDLFGDC